MIEKYPYGYSKYPLAESIHMDTFRRQKDEISTG